MRAEAVANTILLAKGISGFITKNEDAHRIKQDLLAANLEKSLRCTRIDVDSHGYSGASHTGGK